MKTKNFNVDMYKFRVQICEIESKDDKAEAVRLMKSMNCEEDDVEEVGQAIEDECFNGGEFFANYGKLKILIFIYPCTTKKNKIATLCHEKRHTEDSIMEHCHVDDFEAAAYLAEYLTNKFLSDEY